jgi:hypothetical protein
MELGGARWPGISGGVGKLGQLEVGDGADSRGPVVRGTRERWPTREGVNQKGKRTSTNAPSTRGLAGPAGLDSARERREASGSWLGQRPGGPQGRLAKNKEKNLRIKNSIFKFTKALEICRRFRRNFDMRIFPKFF